MPYTPVNFQDGITPLNAATLDRLDDAIVELDARPQGGGAGVTAEWTWNTTTTEPPAAGQIRADNADQALATKLWLTEQTAAGTDLANILAQLKLGEQVYVQDKDDAAKWRTYSIRAAVIDKGVYWEIPVTYVKGGNALIGQRVLVNLSRAGGADLSYDGDYAPATTYQDGDVVVKDGVAYLCVGGPTTTAPDPAPWGATGSSIPPVVNGQWLKGSGGAMIWSPIAIADVTNLQASLDAKQAIAQKNGANGYAGLDGNIKLIETHIPVRIYTTAAPPPNNDLNQIVASGWYNNSNMANAPSADWWYVFCIYVNDNYIHQQAFEMISTNPSRRLRQKSGTWGAWVTI